jgi:hypothetical protein
VNKKGELDPNVTLIEVEHFFATQQKLQYDFMRANMFKFSGNDCALEDTDDDNDARGSYFDS